MPLLFWTTIGNLNSQQVEHVHFGLKQRQNADAVSVYEAVVGEEH